MGPGPGAGGAGVGVGSGAGTSVRLGWAGTARAAAPPEATVSVTCAAGSWLARLSPGSGITAALEVPTGTDPPVRFRPRPVSKPPQPATRRAARGESHISDGF